MKKVYFLFCILYACFIYGQNASNPLVIFNGKNIGYKNPEDVLKTIKKQDLATLGIFKGDTEDALKKYGSNSGVVVITTKKFILDTFYKNNIENSPLKKEIPTTDILSKIGIVVSKAENKNQPYEELSKYINIDLSEDSVLKIASITFIKPVDAVKMNSEWKFGAIEIMSTLDR